MADLKTEFCIIGKEKDSFIESYAGEPLVPSPNRENFFIVIEILHKFLEGETIAEAITETFRKSFYQTDHADGYTRFEEALKQVNMLVLQLEEEEGIILKNFNVAIGAILNQELFVSQCKDAEIYLIRKGYVSIISEGLSEGYVKPGKELFKNISSGTLEEGDHVLFATGRLIRYISNNDLGRHFYGQKLPEVLHKLDSDLSTEVLGRIGTLAFEFSLLPANLSMGASVKKENITTRTVVHFTRIKKTLASLIDFFNFIPSQSAHHVEAHKVETILEPHNVSKRITRFDFLSNYKEKLENHFSPKSVKIGAGVISIFIILIVAFAITRGAQLSAINQYDDILTNARAQIAKAQSKTNKEEAATLLSNAEESLKPALAAKYVRSEANKILSEIKAIRFQFDEVITVDKPQIVTSIQNISDKGPLQGLLKFDQGLFGYNNQELIEILLDATKTPINLLDTNAILDATILTEDNSAYFMIDNGRILEYSDGLAKFIDSEDAAFKSATAITSFGSRMYLLDNKGKQIWKYSKKRDSFGTAEPFLQSTTLPPSKDIAIDGSIYVLTDNNQILRYFGGKIDNFLIVDAPLVPPQNPTKIFTNEDESFLYILDPTENRVMLYYKNQQTKNIEYVRQYYFPTVNNITAFSPSIDDKKLYVADDETIYVTELK